MARAWSENELTPEDYARGRLSNRTYLSKSFVYTRTNSDDDGQPARFISHVFDPESAAQIERVAEEFVVSETPAGRFQVKTLISREAGNVKELWIYRVPADPTKQLETKLHLQQPELKGFIDFVKSIESLPVNGNDSVRLDDEVIHAVLADPAVLASQYTRDPDAYRQAIANDDAAKDVIALAARRAAVNRFRRLLDEPKFFDEEVALVPGKKPQEAVWQRLFEENPWMLGATLSTQFLSSWSDEKLEQVVTGTSISTVGKRTDALLRTNGQIRSMVFAEIKHHRTDLLKKVAYEYRSGCWAPSTEMAGGVAQAQGTVHQAVEQLGLKLEHKDSNGNTVLGDFTYLVRPRSYLVIGSLTQLQGETGGNHDDKVRSFELYRRSLVEPEIVTFDEILARAEWLIDNAAAEG